MYQLWVPLILKYLGPNYGGLQPDAKVVDEYIHIVCSYVYIVDYVNENTYAFHTMDWIDIKHF